MQNYWGAGFQYGTNQRLNSIIHGESGKEAFPGRFYPISWYNYQGVAITHAVMEEME
jgi:hypothetical protein